MSPPTPALKGFHALRAGDALDAGSSLSVRRQLLGDSLLGALAGCRCEL